MNNFVTAEDYLLAKKQDLEANQKANDLFKRLARNGMVKEDDLSTADELVKLTEKLDQNKQETNTYKDIAKEQAMRSAMQPQAMQQKVANLMPSTGQVDMQKALMGSLLKDTPEGHYQNAIAKAQGESELNKSNYTRAFKRLQNEAQNSFGKVIESNPELQGPEAVREAQKYHGVLTRYAPSLAVDPVVAGSFIKKSINYGGVDEQGVSNLIKTNLDDMKHQANLEDEVN